MTEPVLTNNPVANNPNREDSPPGLRASLRQAWGRVWPLLLVGLLLRLLFLLVGAKFYYAGRQVDIYTNGDTFSYVLSFTNWLHHGHYTFDLTEPQAAVGRMPGYPSFYGLHYVIFGPARALAATAFTQVLLDTAGIWLIYVITARLAPPRSWAPLLASLLLTAYPFSIVWTTIAGTESLGVFLVLLWWAVLVLAKRQTRTLVLLGVLLAVILYVREFLGVCLAVTLLYLLLAAVRGPQATVMQKIRPVGLLLVGFLALYTWWPVRNYLLLGQFIPLKPAAAGYANLREDVQSGLAWMLTWTNDVTAATDELLYAEKPTFPAYVISTPAERQLLDSLVVLSRSCASSFHVRIKQRPTARPANLPAADPDAATEPLDNLRYHNCNQLVSNGFIRLRQSFVRRHPVRALVDVPLQNLQKIVFKSQLKAGGGAQNIAQKLITLLFAWRSLLVVLGLLGVWKFRKETALLPGVLFVGVIYGYMAIIFRTMEMRYLLQADVILLVPAALLLAGWLPQRRPASPVLPRVQ